MRKFYFTVLAVCIAGFLPLMAAVQDITVSASVNKTSLLLDDELVLTVTLEGAATELAPQLPSLPAFNIYARSASQQIHNAHSSSTFEYIMLPRFPGQTVIGPITVQYGNKTYKTDPITVTVYRADNLPQKTPRANTPSPKNTSTTTTAVASAPAPADMPALEKDLYNQALKHSQQNFFMIAARSLSNPYANQTFIFAVRFYFSKPFSGSAPYTQPTTENLFFEEINRSEGRQTIAGKNYNYIEIRYAASGVTPGTASIGPAAITYIPINQRDISFFDRVFAAMAQDPQTIQSPSQSISIRPVPSQNRPKSFYGAVGSGYSLSASLDRDTVEAGEAVNLTVKVNGPGNLKSTSDLQMPDIPGFKVYDVVSTSGAVPGNGTLKSYKIFKTVLVPIASGHYIIPSLSWSYFQPGTQEYRTLRTEPLALQVTPSSKTDSGFDFSSHSDLGNGFQQLGQDIHYVKSSLYTHPATLLERFSRLTGLTYGFPILLLCVFLFGLTDKRTLASKHALTKVRNQLKKASQPEQIADALAAYLQLRYHIHTASLPLREILQHLQKQGCSATAIDAFSDLWQQLDTARFAPGAFSQDSDSLSKQALEIIRLLDQGARS